jgi:hypothetical protein
MLHADFENDIEPTSMAMPALCTGRGATSPGAKNCAFDTKSAENAVGP